MKSISFHLNTSRLGHLLCWLLFIFFPHNVASECGDLLQEHSQCLSGSHQHQRIRYPRFTPLTNLIGDASIINIERYQNLTSTKGESRPSTLAILSFQRPAVCNKPETFCHLWLDKFRSIDGSCNNPINPYWGSSMSTFNRFFAPLYSDGFNSPKGMGNQKPFPNARLVSTIVCNDLDQPDPKITNMVPLIGQFIDHDISLTAEPDLACCTDDRQNPDCFNIEIPEKDYFYSNLSVPQRCMDFTRSTAYCFPTKSGLREQVNTNTAYVDASQVYGSDNERATYLRAFEKGLLAANAGNEKFMITIAEVEQKFNVKIPFTGGKYLAGDNRVNEMPVLTTIHTLMFREHNRIAKQISQARPNWNDDKIYFETRRLVGAQWQNIVYGQFLSVVLGSKYQKRYKLELGDENAHHIHSLYNPSLDATLFHEFSTAAYRFGHTLINGLGILAHNLQVVGSFLERDNFFSPEQIEKHTADGDGYNLILAGLMIQNSQKFDRWVSVDFTNFLFKPKTQNYGSDLVAKNIQRSRDHAIENYDALRKICGLEPLSPSWLNRPKEIRHEFWDRLRAAYETPQQIELFPGGVSESPVDGGVPGPTFACIIALQFYRLKFGDRYFFTHALQPGSFTRSQLKQIRRRTLGDIICDNSEVQKTTKNVFLTNNPYINPWINCDDPSRAKLKIEDFLKY